MDDRTTIRADRLNQYKSKESRVAIALVLQMTPEKHREIALRAKAQGVSINHYINSRL